MVTPFDESKDHWEQPSSRDAAYLAAAEALENRFEFSQPGFYHDARAAIDAAIQTGQLVWVPEKFPSYNQMIDTRQMINDVYALGFVAGRQAAHNEYKQVGWQNHLVSELEEWRHHLHTHQGCEPVYVRRSEQGKQ